MMLLFSKDIVFPAPFHLRSGLGEQGELESTAALAASEHTHHVQVHTLTLETGTDLLTAAPVQHRTLHSWVHGI